MQRVYYVSSYFWDRALESGIIDDKAAIEWKTSPAVSASGITVTQSRSRTLVKVSSKARCEVHAQGQDRTADC